MKSVALGKIGSKFFAYVQIHSIETVRLGELQGPLGLTPMQEQTLLKRLATNGFIFRLKRGVYLVPSKIPPGNYWQPNELYLIASYMKEYNALYYIGGLAALHHHNLTEQVPNSFTVYNNKISARKALGKISIRFIKVSDHCFLGLDEIELPRQNKIYISNLAHTILDAVNNWKLGATLPQAFQWVINHSNDEVFLDDFITLAKLYAHKNTIRRIGYILELAKAEENKLSLLSQELAPIQSWIPLDPTQKARGKMSNTWRIIDNVETSQRFILK